MERARDSYAVGGAAAGHRCESLTRGNGKLLHRAVGVMNAKDLFTHGRQAGPHLDDGNPHRRRSELQQTVVELCAEILLFECRALHLVEARVVAWRTAAVTLSDKIECDRAADDLFRRVAMSGSQ